MIGRSADRPWSDQGGLLVLGFPIYIVLLTSTSVFLGAAVVALRGDHLRGIIIHVVAAAMMAFVGPP